MVPTWPVDHPNTKSKRREVELFIARGGGESLFIARGGGTESLFITRGGGTESLFITRGGGTESLFIARGGGTESLFIARRGGIRTLASRLRLRVHRFISQRGMEGGQREQVVSC